MIFYLLYQNDERCISDVFKADVSKSTAGVENPDQKKDCHPELNPSEEIFDSRGRCCLPGTCHCYFGPKEGIILEGLKY